MTTTTSGLILDQSLLDAIIRGTHDGLSMTSLAPPAVGASKIFTATNSIAVIVGLVGRCNGTMTLTMSERAMLLMAGRLMCEEQTEVSEDSFDAIMEVGNMIAGCLKETLSDSTEFSITNISVPSLILGASYNVYYTRGVNTASVTFELEEVPYTFQADRFFSTTVSLMRQVA